jgi:hypothetical protein
MAMPQVSVPVFISDDEYAAEWKRLRELGVPPEAPEYEALFRRVAERNEHLWHAYGVPLMSKHQGQWVAISSEGEVLLAATEIDAFEQADERFGPGNAYVARLTPDRGIERLGPRADL